jgi:hypothetical protein
MGRSFFADTIFNFNISNTDKCAEVAFSKDGLVGTDVEKLKEIGFTDYFTQE